MGEIIKLEIPVSTGTWPGRSHLQLSINHQSVFKTTDKQNVSFSTAPTDEIGLVFRINPVT